MYASYKTIGQLADEERRFDERRRQENEKFEKEWQEQQQKHQKIIDEYIATHPDDCWTYMGINIPFSIKSVPHLQGYGGMYWDVIDGKVVVGELAVPAITIKPAYHYSVDEYRQHFAYYKNEQWYWDCFAKSYLKSTSRMLRIPPPSNETIIYEEIAKYNQFKEREQDVKAMMEQMKQQRELYGEKIVGKNENGGDIIEVIDGRIMFKDGTGERTYIPRDNETFEKLKNTLAKERAERELANTINKTSGKLSPVSQNLIDLANGAVVYVDEIADRE